MDNDANVDQLVLDLSRITDQVRAGIEDLDDPWVPLHAVLPIAECDGFMWMGACMAAIIPASRSFISTDEALTPNPDWERAPIFRYKHGITRRYLNLGSDLRPYYYVGSTADFGENTYAHVIGGADRARQLDWAIQCVFQDLEQFGATRTTAYNDDYIAERNARLVALGYRVVG